MYQSLQDYKNFLIERKLAPENHITFYVNWVSKFIRFSNEIIDKPIHLKMQLFIDDLKDNPKLNDWQIAQAKTAIRVYVRQFHKDETPHTSESMPGVQKGFADVKTTLGKIRESIRIQHYSYSTEKTGTDGFKRFYDYQTWEMERGGWGESSKTLNRRGSGRQNL